MISTTWSNNEPLDTNASSSADTFHGDLFGDELMDIYHIVTNEGTDDDPTMIPNGMYDYLEYIFLYLNSFLKENCHRADLSIIQAVLDSTVGPPSGMKATEDLGMLKSSLSFNDLLVTSSDKVARVDPLYSDGTNAVKRKSEEDLSVTTPSKKANTSKQGKRNPNIKSAAALQVAIDSSRDEKLDIKIGLDISTGNKGAKEKERDGSILLTNDNVDISAQTVLPAQVDSEGVHQTIIPPLPSSHGSKTNGQITTTVALDPSVDGEQAGMKLKAGTASLLGTKNPPLLSTYASQSSGTESNQVIVKAEDNFKGVAKAAVLNLIQNACNARVTSGSSITEDSDSEESTPSFKKPVDTSTAHVQALTSDNWMNACSSSVSSRSNVPDPAPVLSSSDDQMDSKLARSRRASLSADERANLNRDRNREHARNTRLRKKAYVEELKKTLTDLVTQRDASELEKRHEKQRDLEVREVRFRVMEEFLKLRARGSEANLLARWVAILEDGFTLSLPRTDYRPMVGPKILLPNHAGLLRSATVSNHEACSGNASVQVLKGAMECIDDALKLYLFVNSLGRIGSGRSQHLVHLNITCEKVNFMMDGVHTFLEWNLLTSGAIQKVSVFVYIDTVIDFSSL